MPAQNRTQYLRWTLLVLGIAGWALAATVVDTLLARPAAVRTEAPDRPRSPLVVPTNPLLPDEPVDLTARLSLSIDSLRTPVRPEADSLLSRADAFPSEGADSGGLGNGAPIARRAPETADDPVSSSDVAESPAEDAARRPAGAVLPDPVRAATASGVQRLKAPVPSAQRPAAQSPERQSQPAVGLGGLVVDETMTPHGRTFYTAFFGVWQAPPVEGFYTIRIEENPTPGRGTLVQVFVNDDVTFQARLQPQTDIPEQALQAARRTYMYVRSGQGILRIY